MNKDHMKQDAALPLAASQPQYREETVDSVDPGRCYLSGLCGGRETATLLEPGETLLKRFTIESCLGRGRFASVYLAYDDVRSTQVALKVVPLASESTAHRAMREIRLNCEVSEYKHVIRIHDMHPTMHKGIVLLLISMEYAEGGSLRDWLIKNKDDFRTRQCDGVDFFMQACRGVLALHDAGIVHGDLKPENLLLTKRTLKVSDLGLSRNLHDMTTFCHEQPLVGACGTPVYMSPEQFLAAHPDDVDFRSDIYSLGVILLEICHPHCRAPFGGSYEQLRELHLHMSVSMPEGLPANIARAISRCLQKNPADRYQSVSDLINDLSGNLERDDGRANEDATARQADKQIVQTWEHACQSVEEGDLTKASRFCEQILNVSPEHENARRMLEDIRGRYERTQRAYQTIERSIGYQPLAALSALLSQAVETYPDHPDGVFVQTQLLTIAEQYKTVIGEGAAAIAQGRLHGALASFERAQQLNPGLPVIVEVIDFVRDVRHQVETTRATIDAAIEQGDRQKAMLLAIELDRYIEQIRSLVSNCGYLE
jgi:serine/threonine protein kinase